MYSPIERFHCSPYRVIINLCCLGNAVLRIEGGVFLCAVQCGETMRVDVGAELRPRSQTLAPVTPPVIAAAP